MQMPHLLAIASALVLTGCASVQQTTAPTQSACALVHGEMETRKVISSIDGSTILVYVRADWAAAGVTKNDTYVPSPKFLEVLGRTRCVIADVTRSGSNELIGNFGSDGIPFFVLLDSEKSKVALLRWGRDFDEFKTWFASNKPSMSNK